MSAEEELEVLAAVIDALAVASSAAFKLGDDGWALRRAIVSAARDAINCKGQVLQAKGC